MNKFALNHGGGASRSLKAFTLAEVLITLAIIGVVAALTIPSVVTNYQNQERAAALKKSVNLLLNTMNHASIEHGSMNTWDVKNDGGEDFAEKYLTPYLKVAKRCKDSASGCLHSIQTLNGNTTIDIASTYYIIYFADGTLLGVQPRTSSGWKAANILIDINGDKKPNRLGIDAFAFGYVMHDPNGISSGKIITTHDNDRSYNELFTKGSSACNKKSDGDTCITAIIKNGWNIPTKDEYKEIVKDLGAYPYPW
ncbi:MAG: type II secretion system protein [Cyanobacteria bacterium SIG30]|nr:type II secretion system protein [Cyanobacteria bacterium SIG30]